MIPIALTFDCDPDAAGVFDDELSAELLRTARMFSGNAVTWPRAMRYAFDEVCGGPLFEDWSDGVVFAE